MANILDRFNQAVAGSKSKKADYAPIINPSGDFKRVTDLNAILLSWNNILLTPTRTYDHDPEYGCDLYKKVFDPADETTEQEIKDEIMYKLQRYDDRATIKKIDVIFLNNRKGFIVNVYVWYNKEESQITIQLDDSLYFQYLET